VQNLKNGLIKLAKGSPMADFRWGWWEYYRVY